MNQTTPDFVYIQKWLNNRQYNGRTSNEKLLSHDEYWKLVFLYKREHRVSDDKILKNLAPTLTGEALNFYIRMTNQFVRLTDLELKFRHRFVQSISQELQLLLSTV